MCKNEMHDRSWLFKRLDRDNNIDFDRGVKGQEFHLNAFQGGAVWTSGRHADGNKKGPVGTKIWA